MASWFYLTLWHGTPEELTTSVDIEINTGDAVNVDLSMSAAAEAMVTMGDCFGAEICNRSEVDAKSADRSQLLVIIGEEMLCRTEQ